jgi:hypothetical protein
MSSRLTAFRTSQTPVAATSTETVTAVETTGESVVSAPVVAAVVESPVEKPAARRLTSAGVVAPTRRIGGLANAKVASTDTQDVVDTSEDLSTTRLKPLVVIGSAKRRVASEERVVSVGDRMPINMVHDAFHEYFSSGVQIAGLPDLKLSKKNSVDIFKLFEDFMSNMISKHPVQFMGLLFRHKDVAERFYAPRISDFVTYVGPHTQIEAKSSIVEPVKVFLMQTPDGVKAFTEQTDIVVVDGVEKPVVSRVQNDDMDYLIEKYDAQTQV